MIYVASPYTHVRASIREERYMQVRALVAKYLPVAREPIFSPIIYAHEMAKHHGMEHDFRAWRRFNLGMLRIANELWVVKIESWDVSSGVAAEMKFAQDCGITTKFVLPSGEFVV